MTEETVRGTFIVSIFMAVAGTAGAQNMILQTGGVDDDGVATAYYQTIDPNDERTNEADWREVNGFNDPRNTVVEAKGYFNKGDLGFFRSIHMVVDQRPGYEGNIAFATVNYNDEQGAIDEVRKVSIVNMEYSQGPDDDSITKFYIFDADSGARLNKTTFSVGGEELFVPAACYSCHGGDDDDESPVPPEGYNEGSGETNSSFLAFDVSTMEFSSAVPQASLEAAFKSFNEAVLHTDPPRATRMLISGLYGGLGLPSSTQVDYVPASWIDAGEEDLYRDVIIPSCRLCHTGSDSKILDPDFWKENPDKFEEVVFEELTMPNAVPSYSAFWNSTNPHQPEVLREALERFKND